MYSPDFDPDWKYWFNKLDHSVKIPVLKKIKQILAGLPARHLEHQVPYHVEEVGGYRICYRSDEDSRLRRFYFVGNHKEYVRWIHGEGMVKD